MSRAALRDSLITPKSTGSRVNLTPKGVKITPASTTNRDFS
jgi:hypothetical protein